ncbi:TPA: hypothetical protein ACQ98W_000075 [Citrobacter braakii]
MISIPQRYFLSSTACAGILRRVLSKIFCRRYPEQVSQDGTEKKDDAKDKQTANSQKKLRKKTANSESVKREKLIDAYRLAGANAKGLQRL